MTARSVGYIPGIDSMRAVAVLSVLLYHLHPAWLPGGFVGVDVFFVISGYVVSASLVQGTPGGLRGYLSRFYARRLIRIYPALLLCLLVTVVLAVLFIPSSWLSGTSWKTGVLAFFGFSNLALVWLSDGYFSPRVEFNPFTHTWSLGVEEQFYLLYPLLCFAWLRQRLQRPRLAASLVAAAALLSLLWSMGTSAQQPVSAFYLLPSRFWELATGALLFQCHHGGRLLLRSAAAAQLTLAAGLASVVAALVVVPTTGFPFPWALLPVAGSALCIAAVVSAGRMGGVRLLGFDHGVLTYTGRASYALYLWHWPVYVLLRWTVGMETAATRALAVLLVLACALGSYHAVELPLRRSLPGLGRSPGWLVTRGLAVIALSALVAMGLIWSRPWTSLSVVNRQPADWYPVAAPVSAQQRDQAAGPLKGRRLFVLGDSHVGAYDVMLRALERDAGVVVQQHWRAGCTAAMLLQPSTAACAAFLAQSLQQIQRLSAPGDVVFLPGLRVPRLSDQWAAFDPQQVLADLRTPQAGALRMSALAEAQALLTRLEQGGLQVLLEAPKPVFALPPFRCADWFNRANPVCAHGPVLLRADFEALAAPTRRSIAALQQAHPRLLLWDPMPLLCPGPTQCLPTDDAGRPLFFDGDHLSAFGNRTLYGAFAGALRGAFAQRP